MSSRSLVYVSFDRYPAPKGAATHIAAFISALARDFDELDLVTVADGTLRDVSTICQPGMRPIRHTQLPAVGSTLIERVLCFRKHLRTWWGNRRPQVAHIRSIFEGYPIASNKSRWCEHLVFEINGLPSIELKYHYPQVADDRELMRKLIAQEQACMDAADLIITVSQVNAECIGRRGVAAERVCIIQNGVDADLFRYRSPRPWHDREITLLYSGTFSSWQGIRTAIEALSLYRREGLAKLVIVGSGRPDQREALMDLSLRLGVVDHVSIHNSVSQSDLVQLHHASDLVLVPLLANDRNLVQGCSPLKLLEAMASGTPVVASDIPCVVEIARNDADALLVRPGSAKAIKDAILRFRSEPHLAMKHSVGARTRIERHFTWEIAQERLLTAYQNLE